MTKFVQLILIASLLAGCCSAQTSTFKVLPWNNHQAALSLTFDDSRAVHLDVVAPELNKRHLRATFFLIVSKTTRLEDWQKLQSQGHEIGNHSVTHEHAADLNKAGEELQVEDAKKFLDSNFKSDVTIFAYPYTEVSPGLLYWVKRYDFAARGGRGDGSLVYIKSDVQPDWYNLPSQPSYTKYDAATYRSWIDKDISLKAWTILQIHGIGDRFDRIRADPQQHVYRISGLREVDGTAGTLGCAIRRSRRLLPRPENPGSCTGPGGKRRKEIYLAGPDSIPAGVVLKVAVNGSNHARLYQAGHELRRSKDGVYSVAFDSRELVVKGQL